MPFRRQALFACALLVLLSCASTTGQKAKEPEEPVPKAAPSIPVDRGNVPNVSGVWGNGPDYSSFLAPGLGRAAAPRTVADVSGFLRRPARELDMNERATDLIKQAEGLRLEAYQGKVHVLIGYGHARTAKPGLRITEAKAEALLRADLDHCERVVENAVTVLITENEFSALTALCFNIGETSFRRSLTLRYLNEGKRLEAANAILHWRKANGVVLVALAQRREAERALFLDGGVLTVANPPTVVAALNLRSTLGFN